MAYREDRDLEFLGQVKSEDLNDLVSVLIYDKDGKNRYFEMLTIKDDYKKYYPDHHRYWKEIAAELQSFGGNTLANMIRLGDGVLYREVLTDVCDRLKCKYDKKASVEEIENSLLMKILSDSLKKMSQEELRKIAESLGMANAEKITPKMLLGSFQAAFIAGGFLSYQLALIVANAVARFILGRGISFAGNIALTRGLSFWAGPIGWVITGLWTLFDIAGTAYRVTIPAVVLVAALRKGQEILKKRYSIAIIGSRSTGKTTILRYLQNGEFIQIDEGTCVEEYYDSFESPIWKCEIQNGVDIGGDFIKKQKELCKDKSLVLFCYNPKDVLENQIAKSEFLQRLQGLEDEKVFFVATHKDLYDGNEMKERIYKFLDSPNMGKYSGILKMDNSFFVNLKDEAETKKMLQEILNNMEGINNE